MYRVVLIIVVDEKAVKLILQNACYAATELLVMSAILIWIVTYTDGLIATCMYTGLDEGSCWLFVTIAMLWSVYLLRWRSLH